MSIYQTFLAQNPRFAALTDGNDAVAATFAQHHAGGMIVLWRTLRDGWSVKTHESWGDPDADGIVVHTYHNEDPHAQRETYTQDPAEALRLFLSAEAPAPPQETDVAHTFQPFVTLRRRPDGRWDVDVDWSESYSHGYDQRDMVPFSEAELRENEAPGSAAACLAVEAWRGSFPRSFILPAVDWQGITKVECVACGTAVTAAADPFGVESWNEYGDGPCGHLGTDTASRWHFVDGTVRVLLDGQDVPDPAAATEAA